MNPGMRMYMMTQGDNGGNQNRRMEYGSRMAKEDGKYQERGIGQDEQGYMLPYREPRPEFGETEMRYRGDDGRWKSGSRRSEYSKGAQSRYGDGSRQSNYERRWEVSVEPKNYQTENSRMDYQFDPYMGDDDDYDDPSGRVIGFGAPRSHYGKNKSMNHQHMQRGKHGMKHGEELDEYTAREWVGAMKSEDPDHPHGGKWDEKFLMPMAAKLGIPSEGEKFWEFYAMTNAFYSDFCKVLEKYGVKNPMCYGELAVAWMHDKDAVDDKTKVYYECIVKPKMDEEA